MDVKRTYRIGIDARFYRKSAAGVGRYTRELLDQLFKIDRQNEYYVFLTEADSLEWTISLPNVHPVIVKATHYSVKEQSAFLIALYRCKLDLVHFLQVNHPILYSKPFVTTLHDLILLHYRKPEPPVKAAVRLLAFKVTINHALKASKEVIAVSEYTARDAAQTIGVPASKMKVIYPGMPQGLLLSPGAERQVRDYIERREPYFLYVGDWRPHKGLVTLLDAFTAFKEQTGLPHILVLCGNQIALTEDIKRRLNSSPFATDIVAPGFAPEDILPALNHYATALVVPSEYEGFGSPVVEGMMYQTVVICSDATSLPEVGGNAAVFFPVRDANALADRMRDVAVSFDRATYLAKAKTHLEKFSWAKCAALTLETYYNVLEGKG